MPEGALKVWPAIAAITWQLRYPATVQPEVKKAQAPVSAGQAAFPNASGAEMELNAEDGQAEEEVKP